MLTFYAVLFATEGTGLMLRKRWAEWFTAILTSTGVPIEIYEMLHRPNALKFAALVLNILTSCGSWSCIFGGAAGSIAPRNCRRRTSRRPEARFRFVGRALRLPGTAPSLAGGAPAYKPPKA